MAARCGWSSEVRARSWRWKAVRAERSWPFAGAAEHEQLHAPRIVARDLPGCVAALERAQQAMARDLGRGAPRCASGSSSACARSSAQPESSKLWPGSLGGEGLLGGARRRRARRVRRCGRLGRGLGSRESSGSDRRGRPAGETLGGLRCASPAAARPARGRRRSRRGGGRRRDAALLAARTGLASRLVVRLAPRRTARRRTRAPRTTTRSSLPDAGHASTPSPWASPGHRHCIRRSGRFRLRRTIFS